MTLEGRVSQTLPAALVVEVNGIGYEVRVPLPDLGIPLGSALKLWIYEHLREDAHDLYGFNSFEARQLFGQLISVSGIGPKAGIALLSTLGEDGTKRAIASNELAVLQGVPGIGKRTAERLVVELKSKVGVAADASSDTAHEALVALGYSAQAASSALAKAGELASDEARIKAALQELSQ